MSPALPSHLGERIRTEAKPEKLFILQLLFSSLFQNYFASCYKKESWHCYHTSPKIISQEDQEFIVVPFERYSHVVAAYSRYKAVLFSPEGLMELNKEQCKDGTFISLRILTKSPQMKFY